jgi:catechol 2,3-dioxygenase-like lactoylglutathione lyase family enzyme
MKLNLDTIIIFGQNIDKLKAFYVGILKLEVIEEFQSEWLLIRAGFCNIGLHKVGEQFIDSNQDSFKFDNNTKIIFEIDEDIYNIREQLLASNISMKDVKSFDNYPFLLCDGEDPEGNIFQLKQKKS